MDAAANNLLNARADLKARDKNGMTPLMHAAKQNKNPTMISLLAKSVGRSRGS
jgi:ankyrin repeat protein